MKDAAAKTPEGGPGGWVLMAALLFPFGFVLGPPLDGLHSSVALQTYETGAVTLQWQNYVLDTNIWVFPLLGALYSVVGVLQLALDRRFGSRGQKQLTATWISVLFSLGVLIGQLRFSAQLYEDGVDYSLTTLALFLCAQASWLAFDRTPWGWALAALVAVSAPLSEVFIIKWFDLWKYNAPDLDILGEGIVSWTAWCYFFYVQFVATLARCLSANVLPPAHQPEQVSDGSTQEPLL